MKLFLFTTLCCLFLSLNILGQTEPVKAVQGAGVEEIYLAKSDGNGEIGDVVKDFLTTDIPIYCIVQLNSMSPVTVKMNLVAVSVKGVKPETKVITTSYKTNGKQNRVNFTGTPDGSWVPGNYRIDIFLDDKPAGKQVFEIQKTAQQVEKSKLPVEKEKSPPTKESMKQRNARLVKKKLN